LKNNTLLSTGKITDEDYIAIYDKEECNIYDSRTTNITVSNKEVLKGYRCPQTGQWRIPLLPGIPLHNHYFTKIPTPKTNNNPHNNPFFIDRPSPTEAIASVYELPSTKKAV